MTEPLHRESGGWTVTLVFIIIVLLVLLFGVAGLAAFAFHLLGNQPVPNGTPPMPTPASPRIMQFGLPDSNAAPGANELPMVGLDDKAEALQPEAVAEAGKVARSFINSIAINDINTMKSLATKQLQEKNPFNRLFNTLMGVTGFEKQPELISVRATGWKIELQYRTTSTQGKPWDITMTLLKDETGWKVDSCQPRGLWDTSNPK